MAKPTDTRISRGTDRRERRTVTIRSTDVQNSLGEVLQRVTSGERVLVTRYGRREAVILSTEDYAELVGEVEVDLDALEAEFDELMDHIQTPEHRAAADRLFEMGGVALGEAAVARAREECPDDTGS